MQSRSILSIFAVLVLLTSCVPGGGLDSPDIVPPGAETEQTGASEFGNPGGASEFGNPVALVTGQLNLIAPPKPPSDSAQPGGEGAQDEGVAYHFVTGTKGFAAKSSQDTPPPAGADGLAVKTETDPPDPPPPPPVGADGMAVVPPKPICGVNQVKMVSSDGQSYEAPVLDDCSFRIEVVAKKYYHMSFLNQGVVQSRLAVGEIGAIPLFSFKVVESEVPLSLGSISRTGNIATAGDDPRKWSDADGDGTNDYYDADDDNDGIPDNEEYDCNLNGFIDDFDNAPCSIEGPPPEPRVIVVTPFNGESDVNSMKKNRVKVSCEIDLGVFDSGRIKLKGSDNSEPLAVCNLYEGNTVIECTHAMPFNAGVTYTATMGATFCMSGDTLSETAWTFTAAL